MKPDRIRMTLNPQQRLMLDALVASGLYGKSACEAAERLVCDRLRELLLSGFLARH